LFGYIKVDRANLLGKEYEAYKGIYCALCKQLGKDYSLFARFILSYDCTFYAMLAMSLSEDPPSFCQARCRFNPLKKCNYAQVDTKAISMAAALSVSSAYYKLRDNIIDSPRYKRILFRLIQPIFSRWHKKSRKKFEEIDTAVEKMFVAQIKAENNPDVTIDSAAEPTANMLAEVCAMLADEIPIKSPDKSRVKRILHTFGYFFGRWIYLIDAADDYQNDIKHNSFNPFADKIDDYSNIPYTILPVLNHSLSEALLSYGLLDKGRFDPVIMNVLTISCVNVQKQVLDKYTDKNNRNGEEHEESL